MSSVPDDMLMYISGGKRQALSFIRSVSISSSSHDSEIWLDSQLPFKLRSDGIILPLYLLLAEEVNEGEVDGEVTLVEDPPLGNQNFLFLLAMRGRKEDASIE